jgi:hypothetical protein
LALLCPRAQRRGRGGFTSLSPSTQANACRWAITLNPEIAAKTSWGSEDVVGKKCTLVAETYEDGKGRKKNKVAGVRPRMAPRRPS